MTCRLKMRDGRRSRAPGASHRTNCACGDITDCRWCSCRAMAGAIAIRRRSINYRANIDVMKRLGVTDIVSLSACGFPERGTARRACSCWSTSSSTAPSRARRASLGPAAWPMCRSPIRFRPLLQDRVEAALKAEAHPLCARRHLSGAWRARNSRPLPKSQLYRSWGCSVIGMTNMPEAKLAREAELCYARWPW